MIRVATMGLFWGMLLSGCVRSSGGKTSDPDGMDSSDTQSDSQRQDVDGSSGDLFDLVGDALDTTDAAKIDLPLDTKMDQSDETQADAGKDLLVDLAPDSAADTADDMGADLDLSDSVDLPDNVVCVPSCEAKECGSDGCGDVCGNCPAAAPICTQEGLCKTTCVPQCDGKECGPDYCGSECGTCADGIACEDGICQDGPCLGVTCSGHGKCVDEVINVVCECDAGYHDEGTECLVGDFCIEGSFKAKDSFYPSGSELAQHSFDSLVGVDTGIELCFIIDHRTETECYAGYFYPCVQIASRVASAYFDTENTTLLIYAASIINQSFSVEISEYNNNAYVIMSNLIDSNLSYPSIGLEFASGEFNNGEPWNSPLLEPIFMNNWDMTLRRYTGSMTISDYSHAVGTLILH